MPGITEQDRPQEEEANRRVVQLGEPVQPFAPGFVRPMTDWEGNQTLEAVVALDPRDHSLLKDIPILPFRFVLLEGERARQHRSGPPVTSAFTPLGTHGYQVTPEDYDPVARVQKFAQWQQRGNVPYDQAVLWLHAIVTDEDLQRPKLTQDAPNAQLLPGMPFLLRQIELALDFGTGEPLAARPDVTALQTGLVGLRGVGRVDIHSFYPQNTGPLAVPAAHYGMRSMSADNPVSWLKEGLGVYLPKDKAAYERAHVSFNLVSEQRGNTAKPRS
jgi:hypothetical protein